MKHEPHSQARTWGCTQWMLSKCQWSQDEIKEIKDTNVVSRSETQFA